MRIACFALVAVLGGFGLLLTAIGCGGGGGGTPPPPAPTGLALFSGDYHMVDLYMEDGPPIVGYTEWGINTGDGLGGLTGTFEFNASEVPGGPAVLPPVAAYTVAADRRFGYLPGGTPFASGGISADGRVAAVATDENGRTPAIILLAKRQGAFNLGSLNGDYHLCCFFYETPAVSNVGIFGTMNFDPTLGTCTGNFTFNDDGVVGPGTIPLGGPYAVQPNGTMTLTATGAAWEGGILFGGELVILAGASNAGVPNFLVVMVKHSTAATLATLNGSYFIVGIESDGAGGYIANRGPGGSDGAGNVTANFTKNHNGVISVDPPGGGTYTVTANGTLTLATGETLIGGVSPTGNFAVFGGPGNAGADPALYFMFR